ncbi:hypothetical protein DVB69_04285 [Sporosarcina sp. BI001-red]|uniref:hypothetical protein n=1 Tax=Sporosarcina sp. BI001-red TaxID=2282866 RepID=UPI000E258543|nr:hypothetical protein [Sporosarcina sp. BI001-red]REB10031.1 hypothetical protein DVB69_04285 [Sporosarcina sp. BI001-red]
MGRTKKSEQCRTVSKLFLENDIDLSLVSAGVTLYQSLAKAEERTRKRKDYVVKGIKFMFDSEDRKALLEVIKGDKDFWQAWVNQNKSFERTGLESDRPTIHRLNPDGNYEIGNIAVLPYGEHQQEHAKAVLIIDTDDCEIYSHKSLTKMAQSEGVKQSKVNAMSKAFREDDVFLQQKKKAKKKLADRNREFCEKQGIEYRPI